jgi:hypothetical protein
MLEASAFREWFDNLQHPDIRQGSNIPSNFPHLTKSSQLPPDILSRESFFLLNLTSACIFQLIFSFSSRSIILRESRNS